LARGTVTSRRVGRQWSVVALGALTWAYIGWSLLPLATVFLTSFRGPSGEPSLVVYRRVVERGVLRDPLMHSLRLALLTTLVGGPMGLGLAIAVARSRGRLANLARGLAVFPLVVPETVLAAALFEAFVHLFVIVRLGGTAQLLGHVTLVLPFVVLVVVSGLSSIDPALEETARDLGASRLQALGHVVLPVIAPSIVIACAVAFTLSLNDLVLSQFLCLENGCSTVPMLLARSAAAPTSAAMAVLSSLISLSLGAIAWVVWRVRLRRRAR
jgi:ABC-type spermidine/putrescine transport system permease subunit II